MNPPMHISTRKQLFADRRLIDSSRGVHLTMNTPCQTGEENVTRDTWWEQQPGSSLLSTDIGKIGGYSTIRRKNGTFRLWYHFGHLYEPWCKRQGGHSVLYAESDDGVHFTKPELGLHEFYGSRDNNAVIPGHALAGARPLNGNSVAMPTRWTGGDNVGARAGRPVRLRFVMNDCKLYAFQCGVTHESRAMAHGHAARMPV